MGLAAEEALLEDGQQQQAPAKPQAGGGFLSGVALFVLMAAAAALMVLFITNWTKPEEPRYVILMIPDGFGPAALTLGRELTEERHLNLDDIVLGGARTYSSDSLVTDSAASATAYASLQKTYNGAIGVDDDRLPIGTIMEAAKTKGYITGCVVTSRVTHATPAAFTAHVTDRDLEDDIAVWQATKQSVDFMMGGGNRHFDAEIRPDGQDLKGHLAGRGYRVMTKREEFDAWASQPSFPVFGLFANSHLEYDVDRLEFSEQPSLAQMVDGVLKNLEAMASGPANRRRSVMMLIEGSRVDHGEHGNDPVAAGKDVLSYDAAVKRVLEFQAKFPENTLVISVADHETGGLTLGKEGEYRWHPEVIKAAKASGERLAYVLMQRESSEIPAAVEEYWGFEVTDLERLELTLIRDDADPNRDRAGDLQKALVKMISHRARIGWTTGAHTGVDVQVYARGPEEAVKHIRGIHENTNIGATIARFLGLNVAAETERLRADEELRLLTSAEAASAEAQRLRARAEEPYHVHGAARAAASA